MKSPFFLSLLCAGLLISSLSPANAAGRKPYGGSLTVPLRHVGGVLDPHQKAVDRSGRLGAELAHCRLLRAGANERIEGELAESWQFKARGKRGTLEVGLRRGGSFHNEQPILARHVEHSLKRYKGLGGERWLKDLLREVEVERPDPRTLRLTVPTRRGGHATTQRRLLRLLARPELAVVHVNRGRLSGCGPFQPSTRRNVLQAFNGHPLGRPLLDSIHLKSLTDPKEEEILYRDGTLDMSFVGNRELVRGLSANVKAYSTLLLLPAPYLRVAGRSKLRHTLYRLMKRQPLSRRIKRHGAAVIADGIWPRALSAMGRPPRHPAGTLNGEIAIAYPKGNEELRKVAALVRDVVRQSFNLTNVSSPPVAGLTLREAIDAERPNWDFALVLLHWSAHTPDQAIFEAKVKLDLQDSLSAKDFFVGARVRSRASRWHRTLPAIPLLHIERRAHHREDLTVAPSVGEPDFSNSWIGGP